MGRGFEISSKMPRTASNFLKCVPLQYLGYILFGLANLHEEYGKEGGATEQFGNVPSGI